MQSVEYTRVVVFSSIIVLIYSSVITKMYLYLYLLLLLLPRMRGNLTHMNEFPAAFVWGIVAGAVVKRSEAKLFLIDWGITYVK